MYKYGRDFAIAAIENRNNCVSERVSQCQRSQPLWDGYAHVTPRLKVIRKLVTNTPAPELVDAYLLEIAKGYGIHWTLDKLPGADEATKDAVEVCAVVVQSSAPFISNTSNKVSRRF